MGSATPVLITLALGVVLSFNTVAHAIETIAIFFDPPQTPNSACYGKADHGPMVTGVSKELWNSEICGKRMRVTCKRGANLAPHPCKQGSVDVTVVDFCRDVCNGTLNIRREAFSQIADTNAGKVVVDYNFI